MDYIVVIQSYTRESRNLPDRIQVVEALSSSPIGVLVPQNGWEPYLGSGILSIAAMMLLLCILGREFMVSGMRMAAAKKGLVVEADQGGKVKTFVQLNAIGWLLGARMMAQDFGDLFSPADRRIIGAIHVIGMGLYLLSAVLTVTSGISYFRRHGHVVLE